MPFTVSHALYALPLRYIRASFLSTTGLILGSMSPDMEYFIRLEPYRSIGHTWQGLWLQALPLCIVLGVVFHSIVKVPLAAHMPMTGGLNSRCLALFQGEKLSTWKAWLGFVLSVMLGFVSHIVLDEFTHAHSAFTAYMPWIWDSQMLGLPVYSLLQYSLSLLGLIGILLWLASALLQIKPIANQVLHRTTKQKLIFWSTVLATSLITTSVKLLLATSGNTLGILVVAPISGVVLGIIIASLLCKLPTRTFNKAISRT
jgi:hypothetical protein